MTRVLILAANPIDTSKLRLDEELREIEAGLERAKRRHEIVIRCVLAARPRDVRRAMLEFHPTIVHFSGHGKGADGIAFADSSNSSKVVRGSTLAEFFELFSESVRCVVLNACYSDEQASQISEHIDFVVGMRRGIPDAAAIDFSVALYDAIGAGRSVPFAFRLACNALLWDDSTGAAAKIPILKIKESQQATKRDRTVGSDDYDEHNMEALTTPKTSGMTRSMAPIDNLPTSSETSFDNRESSHQSRSALAEGFAVALAAAFFWGIGNTASKWTIERYPLSAFDVSFLKYLSAGILLAIAGVGYKLITKAPGNFLPSEFLSFSRRYRYAAIAKGLNIYFWLLAAAYSSASLTAALENLHIFWTSLLLTLTLGANLPRNWFGLCFVILLGAFFIADIENANETWAAGVVLGILSGASFSAFSVLWSVRPSVPIQMWQRAIEMGALLIVSGLILLPIHFFVNELWLHGPRIPFTDISGLDLLVQSLNGVLGIGITYFLISESLYKLQSFSVRSSLFVGLGLSFVVPITAISEFVVIGNDWTLVQLIGVGLFVAGYTLFRGAVILSQPEERRRVAPD
ncbi:MAG: EamA family transporter [Planctomycetota bacterium]